MLRQAPPTVKDKIRGIGYRWGGNLKYAASSLSRFPDLQAKAEYEEERFKNWVTISGADSYDHEGYLNNLEHRVEYQRINDLLKRLYYLSKDVKARITKHTTEPRWNQDYYVAFGPGGTRTQEPRMSDAAFTEMVLPKYKDIEKLIDECYAFKPIVY
ncbi:hypothetical protein B0H65DRAFT_550325 [Neurospora tetraspora]|uniref:Uncharacterized protein n=1 Tax=Neurospora tetraspora TaxID=94610 RepID=A0AAE0JDG8_9PEZI|nr:hypothetical protein B0H65DRAFT_550325 [Neurospora tetraspora]